MRNIAQILDVVQKTMTGEIVRDMGPRLGEDLNGFKRCGCCLGAGLSGDLTFDAGTWTKSGIIYDHYLRVV